jgi:hypothetical protein
VALGGLQPAQDGRGATLHQDGDEWLIAAALGPEGFQSAEEVGPKFLFDVVAVVGPQAAPANQLGGLAADEAAGEGIDLRTAVVGQGLTPPAAGNGVGDAGGAKAGRPQGGGGARNARIGVTHNDLRLAAGLLSGSMM